MTEALLTWGDVVRVVESAPEQLQPGRTGSVYAIDTIESDEHGRELGLAVGATIVSVEFPDGSTITTTPDFLRRVDSAP
ncbi:MAG: hypothetical protein ABI689_12880 [Thermoanaerobaculia bacterium]